MYYFALIIIIGNGYGRAIDTSLHYQDMAVCQKEALYLLTQPDVIASTCVEVK